MQNNSSNLDAYNIYLEESSKKFNEAIKAFAE